jgi:CopA family copper-resistance protein
MDRRRFLHSSLLLGSACGWQALLPAWAQSAGLAVLAGVPGLQGNDFDLTVATSAGTVAGRRARPITLNGQFPAPLLRWREGDDLTLRIHNQLNEATSIHWHGLLLPWQMDGVPGVSFPGIAPGETFVYRFPLQQAGTYWYHSHSGLQEQIGHYGPIIIDPREPESYAYEREYVVLLSDWSVEKPERVFARLKKMSDSYNFQQRTVFDFFRDLRADGLDATLTERMMWGDMRMNATDLADVTAATYTYLVNGHSPAENWTALFTPGERIRLRFINASAMSIFNVRIPGLPLTVVQADGLDVQPVETDEFQIGTAETFDVIVQPHADQAFAIYAESNDRYGYAAATLAPRNGMQAEVPPLRKRPLLTMKDMGHAPSPAQAQATAAQVQTAAEHLHHEPGTPQPATQLAEGAAHAGVDHSAHGVAGTQAHPHPMGPGVASVAANAVNRLHERPLGLEHEPHRVLVYSELRSLHPNPDQRSPGRELELHLTANMERYMWSFDGLKFSEVSGPIPLQLNERVRLTFVNDTMMPHPIHLHGMFFDVVNGDSTHKPRKHTLVLKPGEKASVDLTADAPGEWAFHCHLLYHMHAGMMRVVAVTEQGALS